MNAQDLLARQLATSRYQLAKAFEGLEGDDWHRRSAPEAMSPYEMAVHLSECYTAATKEFYGEHHEWGSFVVENDDPSTVFAKMLELRDQAAETLLVADDDKAHDLATDFVLLHDAYHIGQLATTRLQIGNWDPYSLYKMG